MEFEMKTLRNDLDKEVSEHKNTRSSLDARNKKYATIEGAKSEAMKGKMKRYVSLYTFEQEVMTKVMHAC